MNGRVLILNHDFTPMAVCTVQRAFTLVYMKKAELVEKVSNRYLRTISRSYPMPAVVKLNRYIHIPFKSVVLTRNNVFKRDGFMCQYCGATNNLTLDHVVPRSKKGTSSWKNLVTACKPCNTKKGDYTPEKAGMFLKKKPYKPSYILFLRDFSGYTIKEWIPFLNMNKNSVEV